MNKNKIQLLIDRHSEMLNNPQFYRPKIRAFFDYIEEHNWAFPLDQLTPHMVNDFLRSSRVGNNADNYYYALKSFFDFTYNLKETPDLMKSVTRPVVKIRKIKYISDQEVKKIKQYINDTTNDIEARLLIGFLLYTGLSRRHIAKLENNCLDSFKGTYGLQVEQGMPSIPVCPTLGQLFLEYKEFKKQKELWKPKERLFEYDENYISTKTTQISNSHFGRNITPTEFSNTFIKQCLDKGFDAYLVSRLVFESIVTIVKHIKGDEDENRIFDREKVIVEQIYD